MVVNTPAVEGRGSPTVNVGEPPLLPTLVEFHAERKATPLDVCDDCLMVAYDAGFEGYKAQARMMAEMGNEVEDHVCIVVEEPDEGFTCDCACRRTA